jgi:hypothetical protein
VPALIDLIGQRFGRLVVTARADDMDRKPGWLCRCDCGNWKAVRGSDLRNGATQSCGCLRNDRVRAVITTHGGKSRSGADPEYAVWAAMRQRCKHPNRPDFKYYGGRGISVCDQWQNSYATFRTDMGPRPSPRHTIDSIDTNGNYEPGNCRWATWSEQRRNTRDYIARHGAQNVA